MCNLENTCVTNNALAYSINRHDEWSYDTKKNNNNEFKKFQKELKKLKTSDVKILKK